MLHIFIDTNVLLRFYSFTDDNLVETEKLVALIETKKICLYVTEQIVDEYFRNRQKVLFDSIKELEKSPISVQIPRIAINYEDADELQDLLKKAKDARKKLIDKIKIDFSERKLKADIQIDTMLAKGVVILTTPQIITQAQIRRDKGNPPGKKDSLGDQINWEAILSGVSANVDLHIISKDSDYSGPLYPDRPAEAIEREWKRLKTSDIFLYNSLGEFTKRHFPDLNIPIDIIKSAAIEFLVNSGSYYNTHLGITKLSKIFEDLTFDDAIVIFKASLSNSQISDIIEDDDVQAFYETLYKKFWLQIPDEIEQKIQGAFKYAAVPF